MATAGLPKLVVAAVMAQVVVLGHDTSDTELIPVGMEPAADHASGEPMTPERITGPPVLLEPMATQIPDEGQATWEIDEVVAGTPLSAASNGVPTVPE
jgi:hypothetical protein